MKLVVSPKFLAVNNEPWRLCVSEGNTKFLTEEFCLLEYNVALSKLCFPAGFLLGLFFDSEVGGYVFTRNVG
jgi:hypothetical protein